MCAQSAPQSQSVCAPLKPCVSTVKKLGLVSPFDRTPGLVLLMREIGYATVSNPSALSQKPSPSEAD